MPNRIINPQSILTAAGARYQLARDAHRAISQLRAKDIALGSGRNSNARHAPQHRMPMTGVGIVSAFDRSPQRPFDKVTWSAHPTIESECFQTAGHTETTALSGWGLTGRRRYCQYLIDKFGAEKVTPHSQRVQFVAGTRRRMRSG
jgi:hypothetical protein